MGRPQALARRALARAGRRLRGPLPRPTGPTDPLLAALVPVTEAERLEPALPSAPGPVPLWGRDRVVRRPDLPEDVTAFLPPRQRQGWAADAPDVRSLSAPVAADLVVLGKLEVDGRAKLRSVYAERGVILATQPAGITGVDGIARCLRAHEVVSAHAPGLLPPLVGHGRLGDGQPYLVEGRVDGTPLASGARLAVAVAEIVEGLGRVHRGHGVADTRLSEHWPDLPRRWADTVATGIVPQDLAAWVRGLLDRDATIRRSWVHGDLVASNVLRTSSGIVLIDWEHSQVAPVMNDGAKLHLFAGDQDATLEAVLAGFGGRADGGGAPEAYSPAEELALAHANLVGHYPARRARLAGHPRAEVYEKQVRRQVDRLRQVHDAA